MSMLSVVDPFLSDSVGASRGCAAPLPTLAGSLLRSAPRLAGSGPQLLAPSDLPVEVAMKLVATSDRSGKVPSAAESLPLKALDSLVDAIWVLDPSGSVVYRNAAALLLEPMTWMHAGLTGSLQQVVFSPQNLQRLRAHGSLQAEYQLGSLTTDPDQWRNLGMEMQLLTTVAGTALGMAFHARDVSLEWGREQQLQDRHIELEQAYQQLKQAQAQLLQSEKMASIGQLAAGVAHEINNPIGYVHSNLGTLQTYTKGLLSLLDAHEHLCQALPEEWRPMLAPIREAKARIDFGFMRSDLPQLLEESREGIERVKKIVMDLRDFSHAGELESDDWVVADLHRGLDSTLNIVWNELKYKTEVHKHYGEIPSVECMPSQLNQVFLNLLVNAGQAIEKKGEINITTALVKDEVCISISDSGMGIPAPQLGQIFDPFFTTKPVGKGTGLGLALSYSIVQKHQGRIEVESSVGVGTTFHIYLPVQRPTAPE